jgi:hypothetical protein
MTNPNDKNWGPWLTWCYQVEPEFNVWGVHKDYLSGAEDNRLQEQLRSNYWDCQEEYER